MNTFRDAELLITERLAKANQQPPKEKKKIKVYTVICTLGSHPHEGTFRTRKEAIDKVKSFLNKRCKRDKSMDYCYGFFNEEGDWSGDIYIVESEI